MAVDPLEASVAGFVQTDPFNSDLSGMGWSLQLLESSNGTMLERLRSDVALGLPHDWHVRTTSTATPVNAASPGTLPIITVITVELLMEDPAAFDLKDYAQRMAVAAGVRTEDITVESVGYEVRISYELSQAATTEQATAALASLSNVDESAVVVDIEALPAARRLAGGWRVSASVMAKDGVAAGNAAAKASDTTAFEAALASQGVAATVAVAELPTLALQVRTRIESGAAIEAPTVDQLQLSMGNEYTVSGLNVLSDQPEILDLQRSGTPRPVLGLVMALALAAALRDARA